MKIIINRRPPKPSLTLSQFADEHGLVMVVNERDEYFKENAKFYAMFEGCCTKSLTHSGAWEGTYGNGASPEGAIVAYAKEIQGRILIKNAHNNKNEEIQVPDAFALGYIQL